MPVTRHQAHLPRMDFPRRIIKKSFMSLRRVNRDNFFGVHPELPIEWFDKHIN
jgi:hypothetical protein